MRDQRLGLVPPHAGVAARRAMLTRTPVALPAREEAAALPEATSGWRVVAGAFLVTMVGFGAIYSYAAFAEEIAAAFGSSRASVAVVYALSGGSCFFVSALTGPLSDRLGARVLAGAGMLLVGLGLLLAAAARSLVEVYLSYGLLVGLGCGFAYVPALAAVQRSFRMHRGLASGFAVSGIGVGTALVPPAAEALSALGDWRLAFLICGVLTALIGMCGALLLSPAAPDPGVAPPPPPLPALPSRDFALAYLGTLLISVPVTLPHAMLVATARDMGIGRHDAVALLGLIGIGTIIGRFLLAAVADLVGRRSVFLLCCIGIAASMLLWACARNAASLQTFALGFGALQGGFVALLPAFTADRFGACSVGSVLGLLYTSRGVALLAAPPLMALGIALVGGHALPTLASTLIGATGTMLIARVGRDRRH
jgi:MFS family permease